jgi:hypothetical protein
MRSCLAMAAWMAVSASLKMPQPARAAPGDMPIGNLFRFRLEAPLEGPPTRWKLRLAQARGEIINPRERIAPRRGTDASSVHRIKQYTVI